MGQLNMNDEIAKNNAKYIMEIMYKTLNYTTLNRGATNDVDHWLSRYAVASYIIANALEKEQNEVSIIGKYDEVMNIDWIIELCKKTHNEDLRTFLDVMPHMNSDLTSDYMDDVKREFGYLSMIGYYYKYYPNYVIKKEIDPEYNHEEYEFIFENLNEDGFNLTYLNEKIKSTSFEYFTIKDYIITNKIKKTGSLKDIQTLMKMIKI